MIVISMLALLVAQADPAQARLDYARKLSRSPGRIDEARALYQQLERENPNNAAVLLGLAQVNRWSGSPHFARRFALRALALEPHNPSILSELAFVELDLGNRLKARDLANEALALNAKSQGKDVRDQ